MFHRLGTFVARHWILVILFWAFVAWGINQIAPEWNSVTHDGDLAYLPANMTSVRGQQRMVAAFPENQVKSKLVIVAERSDGPLSAVDYAITDAIAEEFTSQVSDEGRIRTIWSRNSKIVGSKLTSPLRHDRGQSTLVILGLANEFMAVDNMGLLDQVLDRLNEAENSADFPEGLKLSVSGSAAIGADMLNSARESIDNTELWTVVFVVAILLLVYRAPLLVLIPLATIVVSVAVASDAVAMLAETGWGGFKIFRTTKIFVIVILFGAGTDYCLFLIARYKEELERGMDSAAAIAHALGKVGDALAASALTTILGLGMMYFADFGKFRYSGPAIALCLTIALLACLTLAPALLRATGKIVFWPFGVTPKRRVGLAPSASGMTSDEVSGTRNLSAPIAGADSPDEPGLMGEFWTWLSYFTIKRPGLILIASTLLMLYPAYQGLDVKITYNLLNELKSDRPSVVGTNMLRRHFAAGDIGPTTVLAYQEGADFVSSEGKTRIALLTKTLYEIEGVSSVHSYTEPLGDRPGLFAPLSPRGRRKMAALRNPRTKQLFISQVPEYEGNLTRFELIFADDPFSQASADLLEVVDEKLQTISQDKNSLWYHSEFDLLGTTAGKRDLQAVTESDRLLIQQLVVIVVFAVLVLILRRPVICGYLILSVLFSYLVTIGITEMVFAWAYAATFDGLDWKVPIFLFVILVAVGEDYNIYLVTRVFEEQALHGPIEGLRRAIVYTGGIITSCGLIMAGTFLSMMSGTLRGMLELGFALSLGVILDTFVVRPILVPAFLALLYRGRDRAAISESNVDTGAHQGETSVPSPVESTVAAQHVIHTQRSGSA